jgi:serine/threonine-protein kinase
MKHCPVCNRSYGDDIGFCGVDGTALQTVTQDDPSGDPLIGRTIKGRYQIVKKLGEGGMGKVYLAEQVNIGRKVALKVLQVAYANADEYVARFRREAKLAASLNHPNIVTIYDFDQSEDGSLFLAMEYIEGRSLSEVIRGDAPLGINRVVRLGVQIAEGLGAAHRAGVIHRDIKPDNVMVFGGGGEEQIKLMDFGIARLRDASATTHLTQTGMIMGTPSYMAPEQAEGKEITASTDLYAWGIVFYEMLSGRVPFTASTPAAVLIKHLQETPQPLRELRQEIPEALQRIVNQALEKKPERRQGDMSVIIAGLRQIDLEREKPRPEAVPKTIIEPQQLREEVSEKTQRPRNRFRRIGMGSIITLGVVLIWWFVTKEVVQEMVLVPAGEF